MFDTSLCHFDYKSKFLLWTNMQHFSTKVRRKTRKILNMFSNCMSSKYQDQDIFIVQTVNWTSTGCQCTSVKCVWCKCDVNALYAMLKTCGYWQHTVSAMKYTHTLVELAPLASSDEAFAIWIPGHTGQAILVRLTHLCTQLPRLHKRAEERKTWLKWSVATHSTNHWSFMLRDPLKCRVNCR